MITTAVKIHSLLKAEAFPLAHFDVRDDIVAHVSSRYVSLYFYMNLMQEFLHAVSPTISGEKKFLTLVSNCRLRVGVFVLA